MAPRCPPWNLRLLEVTFSRESPPPPLPITLPPSPLSSHSHSSASTSAFHPLNFITFRQKGIYSATKVIAALMEWASCAIDSFKLFWLFSAHMQRFVVRSAPSSVPADPRSLGSFPSKCSSDCVRVCVFFYYLMVQNLESLDVIWWCHHVSLKGWAG